MKIILDKSNGEFEERDLQYLALLESSPEFEKHIITARKNCQIDKPVKNYSDTEIYSIASKHAEIIVNAYNLPSSWSNLLKDFIIMDKFRSPRKGIFLAGLAYKIDPEGKKQATDFTIKVTQRTSFDTLRRWLRQNKPTIEKHLKELPKKNTSLRANVELRIEMMSLYGQKYKPEKIYKELLKRHPDKQDLIPSSAEISNIIYNLKKIIKRKS